MPKFGTNSLNNLAGCHEDLRRIADEAIKIFDFSVVCGRRGKAEQEKAFAEGKTKLHYPQSKHNAEAPALAKAFDLCPYRDGKLQWNDREAFVFLAGVIKGIALVEGIKIRWGGDFNRDNNLHNDSFVDFPHFELEV